MRNATPRAGQTSWAAKPVSFLEAINICINKYADFSGRASRSEFWFFTLAYSIAANLPAVGWIAWIAFGVPCASVSARRLHDTGKSGWWQLLPDTLLILAFVIAAKGIQRKGIFSYTISDGAASGASIFLLAAVISFLVLFCPKGQDQRNRFDGDAPPSPPPRRQEPELNQWPPLPEIPQSPQQQFPNQPPGNPQ